MMIVVMMDLNDDTNDCADKDNCITFLMMVIVAVMSMMMV
jgi:hypothetical protein